MVASSRYVIRFNADYIATAIMLARSTGKTCGYTGVGIMTGVFTGICVTVDCARGVGADVCDATDAGTAPSCRISLGTESDGGFDPATIPAHDFG